MSVFDIKSLFSHLSSGDLCISSSVCLFSLLGFLLVPPYVAMPMSLLADMSLCRLVILPLFYGQFMIFLLEYTEGK